MASRDTSSTTSSQAQQSQTQQPRGANRSTKVAGKLKVLPEQPEPTNDFTATQSKVSGSPRIDQVPPQRFGGQQSRRLTPVEEENERPQTDVEGKRPTESGDRNDDEEEEEKNALWQSHGFVQLIWPMFVSAIRSNSSLR